MKNRFFKYCKADMIYLFAGRGQADEACTTHPVNGQTEHGGGLVIAKKLQG